MEGPRSVHSADSVRRGEGLELAGRQNVPLTSDARRQSLGAVKVEAVLCGEGNLKDTIESIDNMKHSHLAEEPVSKTQWTLNQDGNLLTPTLQPPRRLQMQYSPMAAVSKSSSCIVDHKQLRRLGESITDIASTSAPSPTYCSKCKKMFATGEAYGRHEPMHMLNIKLFPCIECGKYYRHNTALVIHRRTHTGEKPYCCSECGRCFNARSSLVTHGKIHSGEKLYSCSECGKGFAKTDDLFNHQLMHYRERKYTCNDCGKCFKVELELLTHRKDHPAEELFLCSVCGKDFTQYSKLLRHQKTHPKPPPVFITSEKMLKDQEA